MNSTNCIVAGKFIVGYVPICGEKEYYLGCACGELYIPPSAYVGLYGFTVEASFLGGKLIFFTFPTVDDKIEKSSC